MSSREELTKDILDSISEGVYTVDKNFRITFFNKAAERITGFKRQSVLGRFCKQVCNSTSCLEKCPIAHVLKTGESISDHECDMVHRTGKRLLVKLSCNVLYNSDDEPDGGVLSFRDMTEFEIVRTQLVKETQYHSIVAHSKAMHEIFGLIDEIADSDASVLIQGESGTGKEMIANAIQKTSQRNHEQFVKVNCSIFPPQLLASELFGHVKGSFTGAVKDRQGRFQLADKGTIFLDEVGEMPLEMQLQLLRILQEGTFERVGDSITRRVDVRVIAATNMDLKKALENGQFRDDLYYRLNVIPIEIPPLRQRRDDIHSLIMHFIEKYSILYKKNITDITDEAIDVLMHYSWPGNVRELENAIEYAFARTKSDEPIQMSKLPPKIKSKFTPNNIYNKSIPQQDVELLQLLNQHQWNKSKVAKELGIGRTTLWRKLKALGIEQTDN